MPTYDIRFKGCIPTYSSCATPDEAIAKARRCVIFTDDSGEPARMRDEDAARVPVERIEIHVPPTKEEIEAWRAERGL